MEYDNDKPTPIAELNKEFTRTLTRPNAWGERQDLNWKGRHNVWPGQDPSGRKLKSRLGKEPFPWDDASDARVPLIDTYINEDVDTLLVALDVARLQAVPTESNDAEKSQQVSNFIRWIFGQMPELDDEAELLANYICERGMGVLGVFWKRETQLARKPVKIDELKPEAIEVIKDPDREDDAVALAQQAVPALKEKDARRVVKELRETGASEYIEEYLAENRPVFMALCPGEDFFAPADVTDLQKARVLFYREFLTKSQLEDGVTAYEWDKDWTQEVANRCKGQASNFNYNSARTVSSADRQTFSGLDVQELYEVIHAFEKRCGPDGVPGIYYTVFSPHLQTDAKGKDFAGLRDLLNYAHGKYPFVAFPRERINRRLDSSRGYGEVAFTLQQQVKVEWDSRVDRASIATIPPLMHPVGRAPTRWGPAVRVPYIRPNEYGFADIPKYDPGSREVEVSVRAMADQYFGRLVDGRDPHYPLSRKQRMVTRWLKRWREAISQMFALCQQFMPDEFWFRVVGSAKAQPLHASRTDIQGKFDINLNWNVLNQDPETLQAKLDMLLKLLGADVNGVVDRTELMTVIFEYVDPNLGERLLQPMESASQREVDDEKTVFARMMTGLDEDVKPDGQAYQLRMKVLDQILQTNPMALQAYQGNERIKEVIDKRRKQLNFQIQQRTVNPMIGRLGA